MKTKQPPEMLAAAVSLLRIADPELTPSKLLEALENRQPNANKPPGKMLTLKEFGTLVNLSQPTIFRMMKRGELPTVKIGLRNRRITSVVAERFLGGNQSLAVEK